MPKYRVARGERRQPDQTLAVAKGTGSHPDALKQETSIVGGERRETQHGKQFPPMRVTRRRLLYEEDVEEPMLAEPGSNFESVVGEVLECVKTLSAPVAPVPAPSDWKVWGKVLKGAWLATWFIVKKKFFAS